MVAVNTKGRRPLVAPHLLWVVALVLNATACQPDPSAACEKLCERLNYCELLPSPLGAGTTKDEWTANCEARCVETEDEQIVRDVNECLRGVVDSDAPPPENKEILWCDSGTRSPPQCGMAAECLVQRFNDSTILGEGKVELLAVEADEDNSVEGGAPRHLQCHAAVEDQHTRAVSAAGLCGQLGATGITAFANQYGEYHELGHDSCELGLNAHKSFRLAAGLATVGLKVEVGERLGQDAACLVFYAKRFRVEANRTTQVPVEIPEAREIWSDLRQPENVYVCEHDAALCNDGRDNDGDGAIDCADAECASLEVCEGGGRDAGADRSGDSDDNDDGDGGPVAGTGSEED